MKDALRYISHGHYNILYINYTLLNEFGQSYPTYEYYNDQSIKRIPTHPRTPAASAFKFKSIHTLIVYTESTPDFILNKAVDVLQHVCEVIEFYECIKYIYSPSNKLLLLQILKRYPYLRSEPQRTVFMNNVDDFYDIIGEEPQSGCFTTSTYYRYNPFTKIKTTSEIGLYFVDHKMRVFFIMQFMPGLTLNIRVLNGLEITTSTKFITYAFQDWKYAISGSATKIRKYKRLGYIFHNQQNVLPNTFYICSHSTLAQINYSRNDEILASYYCGILRADRAHLIEELDVNRRGYHFRKSTNAYYYLQNPDLKLDNVNIASATTSDLRIIIANMDKVESVRQNNITACGEIIHVAQTKNNILYNCICINNSNNYY